MRKSWSGAWLITLIWVILIGLGGVARADQFPSKPLTHLVPGPPGGVYDRVSRALTAGWEVILGQPVKYVHFQTGQEAAAWDKLASAPADGYTTMIISLSQHSLNLLSGRSTHGWAEAALLGAAAVDPKVLLVPSASPFNSATEFIAAGKTADPPLSLAAAGAGRLGNLAASTIIEQLGLQAKIVPFPNEVKALSALAGKRLTGGVCSYYLAAQRRDFVKVLALTAPERTPAPPWDPPTLIESSGLARLSFVEPLALIVRGETAVNNPEVFRHLVETMVQALASPQAAALIEEENLAPIMTHWSPEKCAVYLSQFVEAWRDQPELLRQFREARRD